MYCDCILCTMYMQFTIFRHNQPLMYCRLYTLYCVHTMSYLNTHSPLCTVYIVLWKYNFLFRYTTLDTLCTVYCVLCTYSVLFRYTQPLLYCVLSIVYCVHSIPYLDTLSPWYTTVYCLLCTVYKKCPF